MFDEQPQEWNPKDKVKLPVKHLAKYKEAKKKAEELIEAAKYNLDESNFWILKTFSRENCFYAGLIISHNGCLKVNDNLPAEKQFKPESVQWISQTPNNLVLAYINKEQGIYEFGEASEKNCKNDYPYAMVLKRLQDRVILKLSKIAYSGVMSESESDEFTMPERTQPPAKAALFPKEELALDSMYINEIECCATLEELKTYVTNLKKELRENAPKFDKSLRMHFSRRKQEIAEGK